MSIGILIGRHLNNFLPHCRLSTGLLFIYFTHLWEINFLEFVESSNYWINMTSLRISIETYFYQKHREFIVYGELKWRASLEMHVFLNLQWWESGLTISSQTAEYSWHQLNHLIIEYVWIKLGPMMVKIN